MTARLPALILVGIVLTACQREEREARPSPVGSESQEQVALVGLSPGEPGPMVQTSGKARLFEGNAYQMSQGKKLFTWFNCNGCHGQGGGGMGPALMDDRWIYGGSIENIVQTLREGRPNGMPSFRGRATEDQIWQLAAYVRSMSGNAPASAAPARSDTLHPAPFREQDQPEPTGLRRHRPAVRADAAMSASLPARHGLALVSILPLTGCNLMQSPLNPVSPQARDLLWLFWVFTGILFAIWLAVMLALLASLRARRALDADPLGVDLRRENRTAALVAGLAVATGLVVLVLTGLSYAGQRRLSASEAPGLTIRVLGHQWWWELEYEGADPSRSFTTANEIHVPVGVPVLLKLESTDVIHSFWVPSLMGKMDLIPGRSTTLRFTADRAGTYRGQCAEFCGLQHAKMGMLVIAQEPEAFGRWRDAQVHPRIEPASAAASAGEAAFTAAPCSMCHQIRGTGAAGRIGPDLTHLGSRSTLGAATLPMSRGNLAAWIVDPHGIKPGVNMPLVKLDPDQINTISAYLEGLK